MIETGSKSFGRSFMQSLLEEDQRLVPELVSTSERFKDPFVELDHFIEEWWAIPVKSYFDGRLEGEHLWGPHWKRKSALASRGFVNHGLIDIKGQRFPSTLWFESRYDKTVDFAHLFLRWVYLAKPNIAMLHLFTDRERANKGESYSWFETGSFGGPAKPGIPNIGWAMAYGKEYVHEVDVERITAAGFFVEAINDVTVVRVTERLSDVVDDFRLFSSRRADLKRLFRPDLFWIQDELDG